MDKSLVKNILVVIGVVIIIIIAYVLFANKGGVSNQGDSLVTSSGLSPTTPVATQESSAASFSNELVILLNSLENLTLNDSVLFNKAFRELRDISIVPLREGNEGRPNPFAPIGVNTETTNSTNTSSTAPTTNISVNSNDGLSQSGTTGTGTNTQTTTQ